MGKGRVPDSAYRHRSVDIITFSTHLYNLSDSLLFDDQSEELLYHNCGKEN